MASKKRVKDEVENDEARPKAETGKQRAERQEDAKGTAQPPEKKQEVSKGGAAPKIMEEGKIFFLYRPRVGFEEAHGLSDVQRFYMILEPDGSDKKRLVVIGKKKIPAKKERYFGFVSAVSTKMEDLTAGLGPEEHETKTQGTRHTEASRIAGEGRYSIVEKHGNQTYLVWRLEVPEEPGPVQQDLCIGKEGSLVLSIKNPKKRDPPRRNVGLSSKADFGEKQKLFEGTPGGYSWIPAKDPSLLDHVHAELLLIGAGDDLEAEFGKDLEEHMTEKVKEDAEEATGVSCPDEDEEALLVENMKKELCAAKMQLDDTPAEKQEWK